MLAPTGTIGLMMDCDTTGIEPELALVKTKKLVGGGTMQFVNQTVPRALDKLGYDPTQIEDDRRLHRRAQLGRRRAAPAAPSTTPVFDTAMGAQPIHYMGHVRMMARGPAVHLGRDLQDGEHARAGDGRGGRAAVHRGRGSSA